MVDGHIPQKSGAPGELGSGTVRLGNAAGKAGSPWEHAAEELGWLCCKLCSGKGPRLPGMKLKRKISAH